MQPPLALVIYDPHHPNVIRAGNRPTSQRDETILLITNVALRVLSIILVVATGYYAWDKFKHRNEINSTSNLVSITSAIFGGSWLAYDLNKIQFITYEDLRNFFEREEAYRSLIKSALAFIACVPVEHYLNMLFFPKKED